MPVSSVFEICHLHLVSAVMSRSASISHVVSYDVVKISTHEPTSPGPDRFMCVRVRDCKLNEALRGESVKCLISAHLFWAHLIWFRFGAQSLHYVCSWRRFLLTGRMVQPCSVIPVTLFDWLVFCHSRDPVGFVLSFLWPCLTGS